MKKKKKIKNKWVKAFDMASHILTGLLWIVIMWNIAMLIINLAEAVGRWEPKYPSHYEAVLECQKMSADYPSENWDYDNCLRELMQTIQDEKGILRLL
jgi:hypothetical protein